MSDGHVAVDDSIHITAAMLTEAFWLLVTGLTLCGCAASFVHQYRFAAADEGSAEFASKAISWVLIGGVAAAPSFGW